MAHEILTRLRFSRDEMEQVEALVANHMKFKDVPQMKESTFKRFLRMPAFEEHLELHRLDCLSQQRAAGDLRNGAGTAGGADGGRTEAGAVADGRRPDRGRVSPRSGSLPRCSAPWRMPSSRAGCGRRGRRWSWSGSAFRALPRTLEDVHQHLLREFAGGGVLLARVIGADQHRVAGGGRELAVVAEHECGPGADCAARFEHVEVGVEGDFAEGDHHAEVRQQLELALEERAAIAQLFGCRLVAGRSATGGGSDEGVGQDQTVRA